MSPEQFKKAWKPDDEFFRWTEFSHDELTKTNLSEDTKSFLKQGFPEDAAPYLSFGLRSFDGTFHSMGSFEPYSWHELGLSANSHWIFGSDGAGNPICIDASNADQVILLDHESRFSFMDRLNANVEELAASLLAYKQFIDRVNEKYGEDGFFDIKYSKQDVDLLFNDFEEINKNIFEESSFWKQEIDMLKEQIESDA